MWKETTINTQSSYRRITTYVDTSIKSNKKSTKDKIVSVIGNLITVDFSKK